MSVSEHAEQVATVKWVRKHHPEHRVFSVPNGGSRNLREAAKLKLEGVSAGVPDLFIPSLRLFIEMKKASGGTVSAVQKDWLEYLQAAGYEAVVCKGFKEAKNAIEKSVLRCRNSQ